MQISARSVVVAIFLCMLTQPAFSEPTGKNSLPPIGHTVFCEQYPRDCDRNSHGISVVPLTGRLRELNLINHWVNAAIASQPADPAQFDSWSIFPARGNCNDYAVTKRHVLLGAGWPAKALLLAEVRLISTGEHHLVLIVDDSSGQWVLDSLKSPVVGIGATRADYTWERIQSAKNPLLWIRATSTRG